MSHIRRAQSIRFDRDKALSVSISELKQFVNKIPHDRLNKILGLSGYELGQMLNKGETTSVQIVKIFSYRAGTIGKDLNAITEDNFKEAVKIAEECDKMRKEKGWKNGSIYSNEEEEFSPLFGIPLSIKDAFHLKGFATTIGCVKRYNRKCEKDGNIITVLKMGGLIPFVKSNMPQLGMAYESTNLLFGGVKNPWNQNRIAGGSTGGEASLLASRSSIIGIGSDIGGSLRNPAQFCGICSLKPNSQRTMILGHSQFSPSINGQTNIKLAIGPMARHVDDLACYMKIVGNQKYYPKGTSDPYVKIIPFDWKIYKEFSEKPLKMRVGYIDSFQIFSTSKASKRAVNEVVHTLQEQGHTVIPIKIPMLQDIINVMVSSVVAEGGLKGYYEMLEGEPMLEIYGLLKLASKIPKFLHWIISKALLKIKPRLGMVLSFGRQHSTYEYLRLADKCCNAKKAFTQMWLQDNLDFIICPGFGLQAPTIGSTNELGVLAAIYNFVWNVLDVPVGALPVTLSKQDEQIYESPFNDPFTETAIRTQQGAVGLPAGIQVVGLPFGQERVLGMMKYLETQLKFIEKHPYPF